MKVIIIIYLFLELTAAYFLYGELREGFGSYVGWTIPAVLFYIAACIKNVRLWSNVAWVCRF